MHIPVYSSLTGPQHTAEREDRQVQERLQASEFVALEIPCFSVSPLPPTSRLINTHRMAE